MAEKPPFPAPVASFPRADIPLEGVSAWLLQGEKAGQVVFAHFEKDTPVATHSHGAQLEIVLAGEVELTIGSHTRTYRKGEHFAIPSGKPHAALVRAGYKAVIVFEERDRYKPV